MKKTIIIICAIILILILVVPMPRIQIKDGGTKMYIALTYKIVDWHAFYDDDKILDKTSVYFFPDNFSSYMELLEREIAKERSINDKNQKLNNKTNALWSLNFALQRICFILNT